MTWSIRNIYYIFLFTAVIIAGGIYQSGRNVPYNLSNGGYGAVANDTNKTLDTSTMKKNKFNLPDDAFKLHYDAVVVDSHNDLLYQIVKRKADFSEADGITQSGLMRLTKGGIKFQIFAYWPPQENFKNSKKFVLNEKNILDSLADEYKSKFEIAMTADDISKIISKDKLAVMTGIEGGTAIEGRLENVDEFYSLGVRYITLTWNNSNDIASSAKDEESGRRAGLTEFGRQVVKRMNELGMLVDVSHLGEKSFWDVVEVSDKPILASHSCCRALVPIARNLSDEQIKAIAKSGGVVMINFHSSFLINNAKAKQPSADKVFAKQLNEIYEKYGNDNIKYNEERYAFLESQKPPKGAATLDDLIAHIEHVINLVGVDYAGLGSDYDGGITPPFDLYDATCYPFITKKLAEKGYSETDIRKILGLNFLRVLNSVSAGGK